MFIWKEAFINYIRSKKGFNLLDIVLSFMWYLSLQSYLVITRDSARIVGLENINISLNTYINKSWFFPNPSQSTEILYSGSLVWTQWIFDDSIWQITWYSEVILDPLTNSNYTYSVKNSRKEFMLASVFEQKWISENVAFLKWNYNWELLSIRKSGINYILTVPSIVSNDLSSNSLLDILNNNNLVYNNYKNLPASYSSTEFIIDDNIDFSANDLVVWSWSISELKKSNAQVSLLQDVYNSYSWTLLWNKVSVYKINEWDLFDVNTPQYIKMQACDLVNYKLKYYVECAWSIWLWN